MQQAADQFFVQAARERTPGRYQTTQPLLLLHACVVPAQVPGRLPNHLAKTEANRWSFLNRATERVANQHSRRKSTQASRCGRAAHSSLPTAWDHHALPQIPKADRVPTACLLPVLTIHQVLRPVQRNSVLQNGNVPTQDPDVAYSPNSTESQAEHWLSWGSKHSVAGD